MAGHLRQRGGSWELVAYAGRDPLTGKRRYVSRAFRGSKREAQAALDRLVIEVDDGVEGGSVGTMGELLDRYVEVFGPTWSPSTLRQTVSAIERHLRPRWGQVQLRRVTPVDIDRFYAELRRRGGQGGRPLAGATVTRIHSILRASLEQAVRWGLLGHNPASRASPPRGGESEIRPPSPAELGRLLDAAAEDDLEFWTYLRLAASSGARRSQVCGLRWSDLDLDVGMATFARAVVDGLDGLVVKDGKTHRAYVVALDSDTVEVLRRHRDASRERAAVCGVSLADRGFVFSFDPDGTRPWRPDTLTHRVSRLRQQVGLPEVRLHDIRHYVATRLLAGGVPISTVAGRLGHARASTTLNVYSHFVPATDRVAADLLASLLTSTAPSEPAPGG